VLSEEINFPKSISIRTLDVIKNLTKEEAGTFRETCKFVFDGQYMLDFSYINDTSMSRDVCSTLKDAGFIDYKPGFRHVGKWPEREISINGNPTKVYSLIFGNLLFYVEKSRIKSPPELSYLILTKAGRETYRIVSREMETDAIAVEDVLIKSNQNLKGVLKYIILADTQNPHMG